MSVHRCLASRRALTRLNSFRTFSYHPASLPVSITATTRPFSSTSTALLPRKDTQDKDSLNPTSTEYSKSGSDDAAAAGDAAFNPNKTRPEEEKKTSNKESEGAGSLDVSPGNPEVSKPRGDQEGGATGSPRTSASGGGSAPKSGSG
ncbi:hypothetical protein EJ04DRAFT_511487 [Polyplosphaeria fusca]|uniref:Uncharacterized protein n=1 Tax=Polyplosphaeria fusca TaxID=682080 RepID=A0A9P4V461_9PLEO|nr:hypothetical protein EJ04DRAFT_511487 [Polyplosphaeria fusca]